MDPCNSPLSGSTDLFPKDAIEKAIVISCQVLHDEAIHKSVMQDTPAKKPPQKTAALAVLETITVF